MHKIFLSFVLFIQIFKGLPLLDCVELQYLCRDYSFNTNQILTLSFLSPLTYLNSLSIVFNSLPPALWLLISGSYYMSKSGQSSRYCGKSILPQTRKLWAPLVG